MKAPKLNFGGLLKNKYVLYLVLILSLVNIIKDIFDKQNFNVALFLLIGYIVSMYSKNMVVILLTPLVLMNLYKTSTYRFTEGALGGMGNLRKIKKKSNDVDNMKGMDLQTSKLLKQQKDLMKNVENMQPLMKEASKFLKGVDLKALSKSI